MHFKGLLKGIIGVLLVQLMSNSCFLHLQNLCRVSVLLLPTRHCYTLCSLIVPLGLASLKRELLKLEWLLEKHAPRLHTHLQAHGIPAVLYASQWFLTAFACPFPPSFVARIIDIMLIENTCHIMQRVAFAILNECEEAVLPLTDFEDILTCLKVLTPFCCVQPLPFKALDALFIVHLTGLVLNIRTIYALFFRILW